ncbi:MAG: hypothetical protein PVH68_18740, partial [Armatimonadota bacterium]
MTDRLLSNARITLEVSCRAKAGETVLILTDANEFRTTCARAVEAAARDMGARPMIMDLADYSSASLRAGDDTPVLPPVKAAVEAADVVVRIAGPDYKYLLGDPDAHDQLLTAERRRVHLQCNGMDEWDITADGVAIIRTRTMWLLELLESAERVRVSSAAGTDFTYSLGEGAKWVPILGIAPLYGEVATTPRQGSEEGVFVVDGPTQMGVRLQEELDREPLRIVVEGGRVKEYSGAPDQVQRLEEFIASGDPPAEFIDEVGIVTTQLVANDVYYWRDGTHHHDCVHIALGNNPRRDSMVHGPRHMDGDVQRPTIHVD